MSQTSPLAGIAEREEICLFTLEYDPEVFQPGFRGFQNPVTQNAPRVLSPQPVITERVANRNADNPELFPGPYQGDILMARTGFHDL